MDFCNYFPEQFSNIILVNQNPCTVYQVFHFNCAPNVIWSCGMSRPFRHPSSCVTDRSDYLAAEWYFYEPSRQLSETSINTAYAIVASVSTDDARRPSLLYAYYSNQENPQLNQAYNDLEYCYVPARTLSQASFFLTFIMFGWMDSLRCPSLYVRQAKR